MLTLSSKLLQRTLKVTLPRNPLWAILVLNEYLSPNDPIRTVITQKARLLIDNSGKCKVATSLIKKVFDGAKAADLNSKEFDKIKDITAPIFLSRKTGRVYSSTIISRKPHSRLTKRLRHGGTALSRIQNAP